MVIVYSVTFITHECFPTDSFPYHKIFKSLFLHPLFTVNVDIVTLCPSLNGTLNDNLIVLLYLYIIY